jgi:hypothetical protein
MAFSSEFGVADEMKTDAKTAARRGLSVKDMIILQVNG